MAEVMRRALSTISEQPDIGATKQRGSGAEARHVRSGETRLLDEPGTECVVAAGSNERRTLFGGGVEELTEGCGPGRSLPKEV